MGFFTRNASLPSPQEALPGRAARIVRALRERESPRTAFPVRSRAGHVRQWLFLGGGANLLEVCSGRTGRAEVVKVFFEPAVISSADPLRLFWESHDPTQGIRPPWPHATPTRKS